MAPPLIFPPKIAAAPRCHGDIPGCQWLPTPSSFPSNRPPPPACNRSLSAPLPQFQFDPLGLGSLCFGGRDIGPSCPSAFKFYTSPHFSSLTIQYMTKDWVRGGQKALQRVESLFCAEHCFTVNSLISLPKSELLSPFYR